MNIGLLSDLHLEVAPYPYDLPDCDILVLAGDIFTAYVLDSKYNDSDNRSIRKRVFDFYNRVRAKNYKAVLQIAGNHEFWKSEYFDVIPLLRDVLADYGVTFLEDEVVVIDDVRFIASTLWTDYDRENPLTMLASMNGMNDYDRIKYNGGRLLPEHLLAIHKKSRAFIEAELTKGGDAVVITHHAPSQLSIHPKYANDPINGAYYSHLEYLFRPGVVWLHGHTHMAGAYEIAGTHVLRNPRGYAWAGKPTVNENGLFNPKFNFTFPTI